MCSSDLKLGSTFNAATAAHDLGLIELALGNVDAAIARCEEALALARVGGRSPATPASSRALWLIVDMVSNPDEAVCGVAA